MRILLLFFNLLPTVYSQVRLLPEKDRYIVDKVASKDHEIKKKKRVSPSKKTDNKEILGLLKEETELLKNNMDEARKILDRPIRKQSKEKIPFLSVLEANLLTAVVSDNHSEESFIILVPENHKILGSAKIRCKGSAGSKRILAICDRIILKNEDEYDVVIKVTDIDGTKGIIPDYYYTSAEKEFLGQTFSTFMNSVLEAAKTRRPTLVGQHEDVNEKNMILSGLSGIAKNSSEKIQEESNKSLVVAIAHSGKKILLHFEKSLEL